MTTEMRREFDEYIKKFNAAKPVDVQMKMQQAITELETSSEGKGLRQGEKVPNFILPDASGNSVDLYEQLNKGPVILTFYRGNWCPYCNMELRAYQQIIKDIHHEGAELMAISPQTPDHSMSVQERHDLEFKVLSDVGNKVANQFNLVYHLPDYLIEIYKDNKLDVDQYNGDTDWALPVSATYIISGDGTVAYEYTKADYKDRVEPSKVLEELKKIQ